MDDATQGLNEILNWSGDFNSQSYALAGELVRRLQQPVLRTGRKHRIRHARSSPDIRSLGIGHQERQCQKLSDSLACLRDIHFIIHPQIRKDK